MQMVINPSRLNCTRCNIRIELFLKHPLLLPVLCIVVHNLISDDSRIEINRNDENNQQYSLFRSSHDGISKAEMGVAFTSK